MSDPGRYLRQELLPEIGLAGQRRIEARAAAVGGAAASLVHEIAGLYARGAGFSAVTPGPIDEGALAPGAMITAPAARAVLAGSRAALAEIRRAVREGQG